MYTGTERQKKASSERFIKKLRLICGNSLLEFSVNEDNTFLLGVEFIAAGHSAHEFETLDQFSFSSGSIVVQDVLIPEFVVVDPVHGSHAGHEETARLEEAENVVQALALDVAVAPDTAGNAHIERSLEFFRRVGVADVHLPDVVIVS